MKGIDMFKKLIILAFMVLPVKAFATDTLEISTGATNIGIGTATANYLVDIYGQVHIAAPSGTPGITMDTGSAIRTATTNGNTAKLQAYNTGTLSYSDFITLTAGATPTMDLNSSTTVGSDTIVSRTGSQTLTNKTLTAPVISTISNTGTVTLPTSTDTLVGKATTDTLTNKTLTSPKIGTSILDTNGNNLWTLTATGSAVNYLNYANGATGTDPNITVTGDANRGLTLTNAGTGGLTVTSTNTGPSTISQGLTVNSGVNSGTGADFIAKSTGDANMLHAVAATGNVGIGSGAPGAKLVIFGADTSTTPALNIRDSAGTLLVTALNNGNVGLGTATPPNKLYVVGTPMFTGGLNVGIGTATMQRTCLNNGALYVGPLCP